MHRSTGFLASHAQDGASLGCNKALVRHGHKFVLDQHPVLKDAKQIATQRAVLQ